MESSLWSPKSKIDDSATSPLKADTQMFDLLPGAVNQTFALKIIKLANAV